jgi:hypothetical protein
MRIWNTTGRYHISSWSSVLIRDVNSGSRIPISSIPDPGSASKNLIILTEKFFLSSRKYDPGSRIRILIFYPSRIWILILYLSRIQGSKRPRIPHPGVKKAPDPRPATLSWILEYITLLTGGGGRGAVVPALWGPLLLTLGGRNGLRGSTLTFSEYVLWTAHCWAQLQ